MNNQQIYDEILKTAVESEVGKKLKAVFLILITLSAAFFTLACFDLLFTYHYLPRITEGIKKQNTEIERFGDRVIQNYKDINKLRGIE